MFVAVLWRTRTYTFQANRGTDILSIMLKYCLARTVFSSAIHNCGKWSTRVARDLMSNDRRCVADSCLLRLQRRCQGRATRMSCTCGTPSGGRHVSHQLGWLPFLQRHSELELSMSAISPHSQRHLKYHSRDTQVWAS